MMILTQKKFAVIYFILAIFPDNVNIGNHSCYYIHRLYFIYFFQWTRPHSSVRCSMEVLHFKYVCQIPARLNLCYLILH